MMERPHILIIEDDPSVCELLFACLSKESCRVTVVPAGEEGLRQIEEEPPELVVLDLNLPGMNGLDVCRTMRRDPWMAKIPVLMLTGQAEEDDVVTGLEVGADDYMAKPFSPKLLVARVKALLRRGQAKKETMEDASAGGPALLLVKTLGYCDLRVGERNLPWGVAFSRAQRQLLAMLISSPGCRVSQEEVQVEFWPDSPAAKARSSFDSLLSRVRKTLEGELAPFESKQYLVVQRGILSLKNCRIDALEFSRLARKGLQEAAVHKFWQAEMAFSSAFSLWQGAFLPADFGSETAILMQDELEQLYLESSQVFARVLAETKRYQEAVKLLRSAQRFSPADDETVRLLYQLALAQERPSQARQTLNHYREGLARENFTAQEIDAILAEMPKGPPEQGWFS